MKKNLRPWLLIVLVLLGILLLRWLLHSHGDQVSTYRDFFGWP